MVTEGGEALVAPSLTRISTVDMKAMLDQAARAHTHEMDETRRRLAAMEAAMEEDKRRMELAQRKAEDDRRRVEDEKRALEEKLKALELAASSGASASAAAGGAASGGVKESEHKAPAVVVVTKPAANNAAAGANGTLRAPPARPPRASVAGGPHADAAASAAGVTSPGRAPSPSPSASAGASAGAGGPSPASPPPSVPPRNRTPNPNPGTLTMTSALAATAANSASGAQRSVSPAPPAAAALSSSSNSNLVSTESVEGGLSKSKSKRERVRNEVISTEETYIKNLRILLTHFVTPLLEQLAQMPDIDPDFKFFLSQVGPIAMLHDSVLDMLRKSLPDGTGVASTFITLAPYFKLYKPYISYYEKCVKAFFDGLATNALLQAFVQRVQANPAFCGKTVADYLIIPIQRLPRYVLLLKELKGCQRNVIADAVAAEEDPFASLGAVSTPVSPVSKRGPTAGNSGGDSNSNSVADPFSDLVGSDGELGPLQLSLSTLGPMPGINATAGHAVHGGSGINQTPAATPRAGGPIERTSPEAMAALRREFELIEKAMRAVEAVARTINAFQHETEARSRLSAIQELIRQAPGKSADILAPNRLLVKEDFVRRVEGARSKDTRIFLCNDVIFWTSPEYGFRGALPVTQLRVRPFGRSVAALRNTGLSADPGLGRVSTSHREADMWGLQLVFTPPAPGAGASAGLSGAPSGGFSAGGSASFGAGSLDVPCGSSVSATGADDEGAGAPGFDPAHFVREQAFEFKDEEDVLAWSGAIVSVAETTKAKHQQLSRHRRGTTSLVQPAVAGKAPVAIATAAGAPLPTSAAGSRRSSLTATPAAAAPAAAAAATAAPAPAPAPAVAVIAPTPATSGAPPGARRASALGYQPQQAAQASMFLPSAAVNQPRGTPSPAPAAASGPSAPAPGMPPLLSSMKK